MSGPRGWISRRYGSRPRLFPMEAAMYDPWRWCPEKKPLSRCQRMGRSICGARSPPPALALSPVRCLVITNKSVPSATAGSSHSSRIARYTCIAPLPPSSPPMVGSWDHTRDMIAILGLLSNCRMVGWLPAIVIPGSSYGP